MIFFFALAHSPSESDESILGDVEGRFEVLVVTAKAEGSTTLREVEPGENGKIVRFVRSNITRKYFIT